MQHLEYGYLHYLNSYLKVITTNGYISAIHLSMGMGKYTSRRRILFWYNILDFSHFVPICLPSYLIIVLPIQSPLDLPIPNSDQ